NGAGAAAERAEAAVGRALGCQSRLTGGPPFDFGIGLTLGEVTFGNIGVPSRLSFSTIGQNVNQVQRIEKATALFGHRVLATAAFARAAVGNWQQVGVLDSSELAGAVELYSLTGAGTPSA
ncbi:MAG: hypothetical protein V2I51_11220, partial [Anderseniella sp.]|nr:hypothetical protein [Anderseniella sp.]